MSCDRCTQDATRTLGVEHLCDHHHAQVLDPILARVLEPVALDGHGARTGPLRPDWGPGWADLTCTTCNATWTGPAGEACPWCAHQHDLMIAHQRQLVLTPPGTDTSDIRRHHDLAAWLDRLTIARQAGLITIDDARSAWQRATRRDRGRAA